MFWLAPLAGLAAGLAKDVLVDKPQESRDRKLAAETQRYSPWTNLRANPIRESNTFNSMLQGGVTGLQMGMDPGFQNFLKGQPAPAGAAQGVNAGSYTSQGLAPSQGYQSLYSRLASR